VSTTVVLGKSRVSVAEREALPIPVAPAVMWRSGDADIGSVLSPGPVGAAATEPPPAVAGAAETVRAAWEGVYHRLYSSVRDQDRAEDMTQEVFCRVLTRMAAREDQEALRRAYFLQAAENLLRDSWKAEGRQGPRARLTDRASTAINPEDAALQSDEHARLRRALGRLKPLQRDVLRMRICEGTSVERTALKIGKSAEAVRQIQHRALNALRRLLETSDA
jgi:RNA polymerase sigma-70 factor (ECF subfamily)